MDVKDHDLLVKDFYRMTSVIRIKQFELPKLVMTCGMLNDSNALNAIVNREVQPGKRNWSVTDGSYGWTFNF